MQNHIVVLSLTVRQFQQLLQHIHRHKPEQPQIQHEVMHSVDDELIQPDIFHPTSCLDISHKDPRRDY